MYLYLPKSLTLHGNVIVSPITALYKWPLVINFGTAVGDSLSVDDEMYASANEWKRN
jgi:hypothetical protein